MTSVTGNAAINQDWDFERARGRYWVNDPAFGVIDDNSTNFQAEIQAALDEAQSVGGGEVILPYTNTGIYQIDTAGLTVHQDVVLRGSKGVKIMNMRNDGGAGAATVTLYPGGEIRDITLQQHSTATSWAGSQIKLNGGLEVFPFATRRTMVDNVLLIGTENGSDSTVGLARGIDLVAYAANKYIQGVIFSNIWLYQFDFAIRNTIANGASGNTTFINANVFNNIFIDHCSHGINLYSPDQYTTSDSNIFNNVQFQARGNGSTTGSEDAIFVQGKGNIFTNTRIWDWGDAQGTYAVVFDSGGNGADGNLVSGPQIRNDWVSDETGQNLAIDTNVKDIVQSLDASGGSITPNMYNGDIVKTDAALGTALTVNAPTNASGLKPGQKVTFFFEQDATGSRTITWNATYKVHVNPTGGASEKAVFEFVYDGTNYVQSNTAAWA